MTRRPASMAELFLIVRTPRGDRRAVRVRIGLDAPVSELRDRLASHLDLEGQALRLFSPRRPLPAESGATIAGLGLRMGDELWLVPDDHPRLVAAAEEACPWELTVVGGPLAGSRFPLRPGEQLVGRGARAGIVLEDPSVSRSHLWLAVDDGGVALTAAGPGAGVYIGGEPIDPCRRVRAGEVFEVGRSLLSIRSLEAAEPPPRPRAGRIAFNRPPADPMPRPAVDVQLPGAPSEPPRLRVPVAAVVAPLLIGLTIWLASRNTAGLLFALGTPLMALGPALEDRLAGGWQRRRQARRFRTQLVTARQEVRARRQEEARLLHAGAPDACELERRAVTVARELWQRRPARPDFLRLRVGWGDLPSETGVTVPEGGRSALRDEALAAARTDARLAAVPITFDMRAFRTLGLTGPANAVAGLARWLAVQAAALHSPGELAIAAFLPPHAAAQWEWLRWLPHVRGTALGSAAPLVTDLPIAQHRLALGLEDLVSGRQWPRAAEGGADTGGALLVLVHEDAPVKRHAFARLLQETAAARVCCLWIGSRTELLPDGCRGVVELNEAGRSLRLRNLDTGDERVGVADLVGLDYAERVSRALSGIEEVGAPAVGSLPERAGLLSCLGLEPDADLEREIRARWRAPGPDLAAPVGAGPDGVVTLDLREHGPHALVGGTSGAGKSEFLRAWVTALATRRPPRRLNFLLVDFKGGTAFQDCARLPHVVGLVTDLDEHLLRRVRLSLLAELKRREAEMARFAEKEFSEFERRRPQEAFPALIVVFDEFEQLQAEHPEFVSEVIVPIARIGRGLGVHLVLGTQRPQGAVPETIRSNTNIRIALRMLSEAQSTDVVDSPAAAHIPPAARGRAFMRLSHRTLVPIQMAYAGARASATGSLVRDMEKDPGAGEAPAVDDPVAGPTDFERVAAAMSAAAQEPGMGRPSRIPWQPPLPPILPAAELPPPKLTPSASPWVPFGLVDEPRRQTQWTLVHCFPHDGHLLIYGPAQSGKSTLLRTIACGLAAAHAPREVWLYGLDFSGGSLDVLDALPHVGGIAGGDDPDRVVRLLRVLRSESARRRRLLAGSAGRSWRRFGWPAIVLLVDEAATLRTVFERVDGGRWVDELEALVREGRSTGIHCVLTTSQRRDLTGVMAAAVNRRMVLRPDRNDQEVLGLPADVRPSSASGPGRGVLDLRLEFQAAVVGDGTHDSELSAVRALAERWPNQRPDELPARVQVLPEVFEAAQLPPPAKAGCPIIGVGGDLVQPVEVDLLAHGHLAICGPRRSGRTTVLGVLAGSLRRAPAPPALALLSASRRSPLVSHDEWWRSASGAEGCRELVDRIVGELTDEAAGAPGSRLLVVIVDDADLLTDGGVDTAMRRLLRLGRDLPVRVVAALETRALRRYSEWLGELRECRHALLLEPDAIADGELFGVGPLPRPLRPSPPGRGYLVQAGRAIQLQVGRR